MTKRKQKVFKFDDREIRWRGQLTPVERDKFISRHGYNAYCNLPWECPGGPETTKDEAA